MKQARIIEIMPYNPQWLKEFLIEKNILNDLIPDEIIVIHHIGSTAVKDLCAKPTIDVLVVVKDIDKIDECAEILTSAGYLYKGENGIEGRRYLVKGSTILHTHHIHIFQKGNPEIKRHIDFRDYLNTFPDVALKYGELKMRLAEQFKVDPEKYTDGKSAFIQEIDKQAFKWRY